MLMKRLGRDGSAFNEGREKDCMNLWFSILKNEPKPHHEGRVYADSKKLGRELTKKEIENNGEILVLDAIEGASYAKKVGDTVILEPQWLDSYQPRSGDFGQGWYRGDKVFGFIFNFKDIHDRQMCVEHVYTRKAPKAEFRDLSEEHRGSVYRKGKNKLIRQTCLRMQSAMQGTNADAFVTLIMTAQNKDLFLSLWAKERGNFSEGFQRRMEAKLELKEKNVKYKRNKDGTITRTFKRQAMGWTDWTNMDSTQKKKYLKRNSDVFLDSHYLGGVTPYYKEEETR